MAKCLPTGPFSITTSRLTCHPLQLPVPTCTPCTAVALNALASSASSNTIQAWRNLMQHLHFFLTWTKPGTSQACCSITLLGAGVSFRYSAGLFEEELELLQRSSSSGFKVIKWRVLRDVFSRQFGVGPKMKGRGLFRVLHVASRASNAQRTLPLPTRALHQSSFECTVGRFRSPVVSTQHIFQPWAELSTAAERVSDKETESDASVTPASDYVGLPATREGQKPRVVVLGSGWAACRLLKDLNTRIYDVVCISPRNHMVFTPLLASTCVGTLEFRSVAEPVRTIQPALARNPDSFYFLARCTDIDTTNREVHCESVLDDNTGTTGGDKFRVAYDKLVIATGAEATTFGIDGVHKHAIFLRDVKNAMDIRSKLMLNLALCEIPGKTLEEKKRLLHCVVVGGGPTGVEFSGELSDFIIRDVHRKFAHVQDLIHVTLIEAADILSAFDVRLREYATNQLTKSGAKLVRGMVKHVLPEKLILSDGSEVPYGMLVWSTGVGPSAFMKKLEHFEKNKGGRVAVDNHLRVPKHEGIYAIGDCSGYMDSLNKSPLPALAQVAEREGKYLAMSLNKLGKSGHGRAGSGTPPAVDSFVYKHLGSMASVGRHKALVDLRGSPEASGFSMTGFKSWLIWRSAYLSRSISWRARLYVAFNWGTTFLFGRDISRF